jgi:ABC-type branched-subunit amino acid transport system substrate-binding protein
MAQQYVQAALIPDGFFVESRSEHVRHFIKSFEEAFNDTPGFIEAVSFDTAMILQQLTNLPDVRSRKGLAMALKNLKNFKGVTGRTSFTETGDVDKDLYILRIRGDKFVESKKN